MEPHLDVSATESDAFSPRQLWFIGIDIYVNEVRLQWKSPAGVWVELGGYDSVGRWQLNAAEGDEYRLTTSAAGSRAWVHK